MLNGTVGGLYTMNCVESLLWSKQNKYHPQDVSATEFGAYIMLDKKNTTVKVYLQTGPTLVVDIDIVQSRLVIFLLSTVRRLI
jgi:hypothetical protein